MVVQHGLSWTWSETAKTGFLMRRLNYPFNLQVIMPGYCVAGTVGHKILNGARKIEMENKQVVSQVPRL